MKTFLPVFWLFVVPAVIHAEDLDSKRQTVVGTPGLVAFWDFVKREPDGEHRFLAHVPSGSSTEYPLDVANYVKDYWGQGRAASYADFPLLGRGPFGQAIRIRKETDPNFRPFLFVPRSRLHDTPLDIKGDDRSVSVVVWAIRESGNHALAGIWHEGTDLHQKETAGIRKVECGQRQYALFAGLNKAGSACGHVSENGASSFLNKYALHKCNSLGQSPEVPADSSLDVLDRSWQCFAMTFDHRRDELTGWLDGQSGDRWLENPSRGGLLQSAYNAYMQGHWHRTPGKQPGEDPSFPQDQFYNPPEDHPLSVNVLNETVDQRTEQREYRFTKVNVTLEANADGTFTETARVHSSRSVGFTGWIGGVAVFDRALSAEELATLASLSKQ